MKRGLFDIKVDFEDIPIVKKKCKGLKEVRDLFGDLENKFK